MKKSQAVLYATCATVVLLWVFLPSFLKENSREEGSVAVKDPASGIWNGEGNQSHDAAAVVQYLVGLTSNASSRQNRKYRIAAFAMTRNEPRLKEFLLRNLIAGVQHFFLYDNNRVVLGFDTNITDTIRPFEEAGLLTYVPWGQDLKGHMTESFKEDAHKDCIHRFGYLTDWMWYADTDEMLYVATDSQGRVGRNATTLGVDALDQILTENENGGVDAFDRILTENENGAGRGEQVCAFFIPWLFMYDEGRTLYDPEKSLMETYPRTCFVHPMFSKIIYQPSRVDFTSVYPHGCRCAGRQQLLPRSVLVHYYTRSLEEFLIKKEQSIPPWWRTFRLRLDSRGCCQRAKFPYSERYINVTYDALSHTDDVPHGGMVIKIPILNETDMSHHPDYNLYRIARDLVKLRMDFNNTFYLDKYTDVANSVAKCEMRDPLHHFLDFGFDEGRSSRWDSCVGTCEGAPDILKQCVKEALDKT